MLELADYLNAKPRRQTNSSQIIRFGRRISCISDTRVAAGLLKKLWTAWCTSSTSHTTDCCECPSIWLHGHVCWPHMCACLSALQCIRPLLHIVTDIQQRQLSDLLTCVCVCAERNEIGLHMYLVTWRQTLLHYVFPRCSMSFSQTEKTVMYPYPVLVLHEHNWKLQRALYFSCDFKASIRQNHCIQVNEVVCG